MLEEIPTLYIRLSSKSKQERLETLSLILSHPDAKPVDLVRCLCSEDNRNGEFTSVPDFLKAVYMSWTRLHGVLDNGVYRYLSKLYRSAPDQHLQKVVHILELLGTQKALDMLKRMQQSPPDLPYAKRWIDDAVKKISKKLPRSRNYKLPLP